MKHFIGLILWGCFPCYLMAQFQAPPLGELFRDDVVPRVDIEVAATDLEWMLLEENWYSDELHPATFIFNNGTVLDTVENVGFRLRGNTSRQADKKSFKVDFNAFEPGRKFYGIEKMNLNGQHNDPTVSRAKICADIARDMGIPSLRSNHVELYINDAYFGLYINVEHVDEEYIDLRFGNKNGNLYKCLYPADLDYKGSNPDLYKEEFWGRRAYELKTNTATDDYSDIAHFIDILNNTPTSQLPCLLEPIFNVDSYLRFMVFDVLTGNWDGPIYNKNNFYLYKNEDTGQFEYIPFDLDNTLGLDWLDRDWGNRPIYNWAQSGQPRPIFNHLIVVQEYRNRFSYYMNEAIEMYFNEQHLFPYLDELRNNLLPYVSADTFYNKDYGFTPNDFETGFDNALPYYQVQDYGIKSYINTRKNNALSQLVLNDISPVITQIQHNYPAESEDIHIQALVTDDNGLVNIQMCYSLLGSNMTCLDMFDDGMHGDGQAGDGIYGVIVPALNQTAVFEFNIFATDAEGQSSMRPICGTDIIYIEDAESPLVINEIMASNNSTIADEYGEFEDWIEVYNNGDGPIFLGDKYLSDNQNVPNKWRMPNIYLQPDEFVVFWADNDVEQGNLHTNFKLSSGGEFIGLFDDEANNFTLIDGLDFNALESDASWGRIPNGTGAFTLIPSSPNDYNMTVSINQLSDFQLGLEYYPNPVKDALYLRLENPDRLSLILEIHHVSGKKMREIALSETLSIPFDSYSDGMYFISVKLGGKVIFSEKLIK